MPDFKYSSLPSAAKPSIYLCHRATRVMEGGKTGEKERKKQETCSGNGEAGQELNSRECSMIIWLIFEYCISCGFSAAWQNPQWHNEVTFHHHYTGMCSCFMPANFFLIQWGNKNIFFPPLILKIINTWQSLRGIILPEEIKALKHLHVGREICQYFSNLIITVCAHEGTL